MTINIPTPKIKNWKTTLAGVAGYVAVFIQVMSQYQIGGFTQALKNPTVWLGFLVSSGLLAAKDGNVTGGSVGQASTPEAIRDSNHAPAVGLAAPVAGPPPGS